MRKFLKETIIYFTMTYVLYVLCKLIWFHDWDFSSGVILCLALGILGGLDTIRMDKKLLDINELTVNNYWKLKKELNKKVNKRKG